METRRGRSSAVAANKEYVVAVGGGRRRNKNCGVGVSSVRHVTSSFLFILSYSPIAELVRSRQPALPSRLQLAIEQ